MTLVDTNVLLDLVTDDSDWFDWSRQAVETAAASEPLCVNAIIYAELSVRYDSVATVDEFLESAGVEIVDIPRHAAFLAAKAFGDYRAAGGAMAGVLSDFFIGAHALVLGVPLLTRDVRRYRTYFPKTRLIAPRLN